MPQQAGLEKGLLVLPTIAFYKQSEQEQDHVLIELDIDILGLDERIVILKRKRFPFTGREEITRCFEAEKNQEGKNR